MNASSVENWSLARSLALLAAVFAMTIGSLLPFAAMAAARPGQPVVICSTEGLQTIHTGGLDGPINKDSGGAKCAACILPILAALPEPSPAVPVPTIRIAQVAAHHPASASEPPPARAPPCPPSQAPPQV